MRRKRRRHVWKRRLRSTVFQLIQRLAVRRQRSPVKSDYKHCCQLSSRVYYRKPGKVLVSRTSAALFLGVSVKVALRTSPICWGLALTIDANASAKSNSSLDAVAELGAEWVGADRTCCTSWNMTSEFTRQRGWAHLLESSSIERCDWLLTRVHLDLVRARLEDGVDAAAAVVAGWLRRHRVGHYHRRRRLRNHWDGVQRATPQTDWLFVGHVGTEKGIWGKYYLSVVLFTTQESYLLFKILIRSRAGKMLATI